MKELSAPQKSLELIADEIKKMSRKLYLPDSILINLKAHRLPSHRGLKGFLLLIVISLVISSPVWAIAITPFGTYGEGGYLNGQGFTVGTGGDVYEFDAFLSFSGTSNQLSYDPLPVGLDYIFSASLSTDATDLVLTYTFSNNTGGMLNDLRFFSFMDAEIDEPNNTYFNEYGEVTGSLGTGAGDADPDLWEIDEPGYIFGDIYDNLLAGALDNTNGVPIGSPDDVSMALGFELGSLDPLAAATINILISEDDDYIGSMALLHHDSDPSSTTVITMSGQSQVASVPEPSTLMLLGVALIALVGLRRRVCTFKEGGIKMLKMEG